MLNIFSFYAIHIEEVWSIFVSDYRPPELNSIWFLGIAVWKVVSTFVGHLTNKAATPALINLYNFLFLTEMHMTYTTYMQNKADQGCYFNDTLSTSGRLRRLMVKLLWHSICV